MTTISLAGFATLVSATAQQIQLRVQNVASLHNVHIIESGAKVASKGEYDPDRRLASLRLRGQEFCHLRALLEPIGHGGTVPLSIGIADTAVTSLSILNVFIEFSGHCAPFTVPRTDESTPKPESG